MGAQLCNDTQKFQPKQFQDFQEENGNELSIKINNQQQEQFQRVEVSSFPNVNKHVQQKINKMTKAQPSSAKLWKIPSLNIVYMSSDPLNDEFPPKGRVQVYKVKENGQFQGYFEGEIDEKYRPILSHSFFVYPNASYLEGKGEKNGIYTNQVAGLSYEGEWQNQQPSGMGKQVSNKGTYEGYYLNGKKHGKGVFKWHNGTQYKGDFSADYPHGDGQITDSSQDYYYKGQFQFGLPHGQGKQKCKKLTYEGQFIKGKRCGLGKLTIEKQQDGLTEYSGQFIDGLPNGPGRFLNKGSEVKGIWLQGKMIVIDSI